MAMAVNLGSTTGKGGSEEHRSEPGNTQLFRYQADRLIPMHCG
jgi:hypothetical protein